jgi:transcriptional regulator with XRE-family HTH domain
MSVSARQQFGQILKDLRRDKRLTQKELAKLLGYTEQYIRHIEAGRKSPPPDLGGKIASVFPLPDYVADRLVRDARIDPTPLGHYSDHERTATRIRVWENRFIPGLLQTEDYMRVILRDDDAVAFRLDRQKILPDKPFHAVVDESILLHPVGTATQFYAQLQRLIEYQVQVVPAHGFHRGMECPLTIMDLPDGSMVAWLEGQELRPGTILDTDEAVRTAVEIWEEALRFALPPDLSGEMIAAVAEDLTWGP